jgi:hypothetical protein
MVIGFSQKLPAGHSCFDVDPGSQYSPVAHAAMVLVFSQKLPAGHGVDQFDPALQYEPNAHSVFVAGVVQ